MKIPALVTMLLLVSGCAAEKHRMAYDWPDLSKYQATMNRAATPDDVKAGSAVFVISSQGKPTGVPIRIPLPQYALHVDKETKAKSPCVVIQAEEANGQRLIGCYLLPSNQIFAGLFQEFELLGQTEPR